MNLLRRTHPGAGLTTAVILLCGIVSGAAMAAGNRPGEARTANDTHGMVPQPTTPTVGSIPTVPAVPKPTARLPWMRTDVPTVPAVEMPAQVVTRTPAAEATDDALVLRPESTYERSTLKPVVPVEQAPQVEEADPALASSEPMGGLNMNGLGLIMFVMLGGAGFFAYRKKREQLVGHPDLTLEIASSIRIGNRWQVSLVRVPGRILVIGSTDKGLELLTELYSDGDQDGMDRLLSMVDGDAVPSPMIRQPAPAPVGTAPPQPPRPTEEFDALADVSPRYESSRSVGTYARPARRQLDANSAPAIPTAPASAPGPKASHDDAFLDAVLERLSNARPAVIRQTTAPTPRVDERAALRAQVKQYRRGPTRL